MNHPLLREAMENLQSSSSPSVAPPPAAPTPATKVRKKFLCEFCKNSFKNQIAVAAHVRNCSKNPQRVIHRSKCTFCKKMIDSRGLVRHAQYCNSNPERTLTKQERVNTTSAQTPAMTSPVVVENDVASALIEDAYEALVNESKTINMADFDTWMHLTRKLFS